MMSSQDIARHDVIARGWYLPSHVKHFLRVHITHHCLFYCSSLFYVVNFYIKKKVYLTPHDSGNEEGAGEKVRCS